MVIFLTSVSGVCAAKDEGFTADIRGKRIFRPVEGETVSFFPPRAALTCAAPLWDADEGGVCFCRDAAVGFAGDVLGGASATGELNLYRNEGCNEVGAGTLRTGRVGASPLICVGAGAVRACGESGRRVCVRLRFGLEVEIEFCSAAAPLAEEAVCA